LNDFHTSRTISAVMRSRSVESSVILSVGYDATRQILKVRFRNGRTYYYLRVPASDHRALLAAPSIGKYLNENIKPRYKAVSERDLRRAIG
jgi:KTSC domain